MEMIAQGAEAKLYSDGKILIKERIPKGYRSAELDRSLRQYRTRREAKVISKLAEIGVTGPEMMQVCDMKITMSFIDGQKLKDVIENDSVRYGKELGRLISKLHAADIVHYDLTTSNMIVKDKIHLIDFGLSFFSCKAEDKAVDLHLFKQALHSAHYKTAGKIWSAFAKEYKHADVLQRLEVVEKRGRYKKKI